MYKSINAVISLFGCTLTCLVVAQAASAQQPILTGPTAPTAAPVRKLWIAGSEAHQPAPVPPGLEIEILDPNVDPRGNPAVLTVPKTVCTRSGPENRLLVDIPETVLVHRYYYTGDRSFQGPMLHGGPCIVVLNHPCSGERLYIPVQMLPGAPRVTYRHNSIEYDYGHQGITIEFGLLGKPKVCFRNGIPLSTKLRNTTDCVKDSARQVIIRTSIPEYASQVVNGSKNMTLSAIDITNSAAKRVIDPACAVFRMLPGVSMLSSTSEDVADRKRDMMVQKAEADTLRAQGYLRTNR